MADAERTRRIGAAIARGLADEPAGAVVIALEGELGAGKTTLVSGVLAGLGVSGPIKSPTYTLVEPYELDGRVLYHLDLYRMVEARELDALGVRDMLIDGAVLLIEWFSRAHGSAPAPDLEVVLGYEATGGRRLQATSFSKCGDKLLRAIVAATPEQGGVSP